MNHVHKFNPLYLRAAILFVMLGFSSPIVVAAENGKSTQEEWKLTLKNAYINRDYDNPNLKDTGSWSQAASLFYKSNMQDTPLQIADKPVTIGADASVQYAVRLSKDKHVADTVLPFDTQTQSQVSDFLKYGCYSPIKMSMR
ncbi:OprD family outer membrane porin [Acinetobacter genomosp. 15BJ]|uniref:OprD family outer membrane porin n=1 Tax=Acinetobacter genomosp. 15BJ TaxID=106651 RepID=A0ABT8V0N8_9GAMM|nr:OprD family outer membrane porin [Acinetobacter genomosp. 15BJ]MDO3658890.1 OprD family outer membrane porin [Acinetobacter genomosp. 15BJ]